MTTTDRVHTPCCELIYSYKLAGHSIEPLKIGFRRVSVCVLLPIFFCSVVVWLFCCLVALFSFVSAIICEMGWNERLLCWTPSIYIDFYWNQKHAEPQQILLFYHNNKKKHTHRKESKRTCSAFATFEKSQNMWNGFWGQKKRTRTHFNNKKKKLN